jgi:hypothetical protein
MKKAFNTPGPQPGYQQQQSGNAPVNFTPSRGRSAPEAGRRARDEVRRIVRANGGKPYDGDGR